ncbi:MAG: 16S rRNA (guanine(527)-N(7))-methyltransferase RsmG [Planctomycetota bacterium]|nr:MAG: 16S rRNA (guanine(527)-N(7))-methyltransferase RsmG [Planctomycetota bacterium]
MTPFPGIPEQALQSLDEPNPLDVQALRAALSPLADPPEAALALLLQYGRLLLAANTVVNLTGARDWRTLIESHFLDALAAARYVPEDARRVADWGSGGGLPGLVWAIVFPEKQLMLVERTGKKADFLQAAAERLELYNVQVLRGQGEEVLREMPPPDLLVARAVEPLPRLLRRLRRNRVRYGALFLMAGPHGLQDWEALEPPDRAAWALSARHRYSPGPGRGERLLLVFKPA